MGAACACLPLGADTALPLPAVVLLNFLFIANMEISRFSASL